MVVDRATDEIVSSLLRWFGLVLGIFGTWLVLRVVYWLENR